MNKTLYKEVIDSKGIKQKHLAKILGISEQALIQKVNGIRSFKAEEIRIFKEELNLSTDLAWEI